MEHESDLVHEGKLIHETSYIQRSSNYEEIENERWGQCNNIYEQNGFQHEQANYWSRKDVNW